VRGRLAGAVRGESVGASGMEEEAWKAEAGVVRHSAVMRLEEG
jgi:hypothetical protein